MCTTRCEVLVLFSISSAAICHLWRWALARRSSVDRGVGRSSIIVIVVVIIVIVIVIVVVVAPLLSGGRRRHISPPRHRNSYFGFVKEAEIGTVAAAIVELERRQHISIGG
jgi:hypothetical protein